MSNDQIVAAEDYVECMGLHFEADGLPRIAGRILGHFILEGGPFSFSAIAQRLKISRASVSTNTRLLAEMGVIERTSVSGERQDYFRMVEAPYVCLLHKTADRADKAARMTERTVAGLGDAAADARRRLGAFSEFQRAIATSARRLANSIRSASSH
jgi:DNA-binding transcriptional regulator GbsR (MarR family)